MGMDVVGTAPSSEVGEYFRRNVWGWHPLWDYCCWVAAEITEKVEYGHSNDGDGLEASDSKLLAKVLRETVADGGAATYIGARNEMLAALPDEPCRYCKGTGVRKDEVGVKYKMDVERTCNGCSGKGSIRPFATSYHLDVTDVIEFADFLEDSGGFRIF